MTSKVLNSVVELNKINYDSTNNRINFSTAVYSNGSPIADETAGSYANSAFAQANAAFASANNVAPQVQPAFDKANAAFNKANSAVSRESFLANTGQTLFITNGYNIGYVDVFVNGIKLYSAEDFTATDGANVSIISPVLTQNDVVEIVNWGGTAEPIARVDQYARDYVNNAWSAANSAYNFANSVYSLANNAANSAASSIPLTGSANISGNLIPVSTNTYYLGSATNRWHSLYVGPGSIDLGGLILSNSGGTLAVSTPGQPATPLAGEDTWVRAQANAAFAAANSVNVYGANTNNTSYFSIPKGSTAQRPTSPDTGSIRYNTTTGSIEAYLANNWVVIAAGNYTISYLVAAGGGGGGRYGGGGAGGVLTGNTIVQPGTAYSVVVGGGGIGTNNGGGANGTNSSITSFGLTAIGGGGGADSGFAAKSGGSGGGGSFENQPTGQWQGAAGTPGQGNPGGKGMNNGTDYGGGGGGGAGGPAIDATSPSVSGVGGVGLLSTITGSSVYYGGGGGGAQFRDSGTAGPGGLGGGGTGGKYGGGTPVSVAGSAGGAGTGGGGGAAYSGGSGVVIIAYQSPVQRGSGGTVTSYSSSGIVTWVHTYTGTGTFTFSA